MTKWVVVHLEELSECTTGDVIQDTLKFVDFLKEATRELTPIDNGVLEFLRQLDVNCYGTVSRRIDLEVCGWLSGMFRTLLLPQYAAL